MSLRWALIMFFMLESLEILINTLFIFLSLKFLFLHLVSLLLFQTQEEKVKRKFH